jgi:hypothetical protein
MVFWLSMSTNYVPSKGVRVSVVYGHVRQSHTADGVQTLLEICTAILLLPTQAPVLLAQLGLSPERAVERLALTDVTNVMVVVPIG